MQFSYTAFFALVSCLVCLVAGQTVVDYVPPGLTRDVVGLSASPYTVVAVTKAGKVVQWGGATPQPPANLGPVKAAAVAGFDVYAILKNGKIVTWGDPVIGNKLKVPSRVKFTGKVRQFGADKTGSALILGTDKSLVGLGACAKIPSAIRKKASVVGVNQGCFALVGKTLYSFASGLVKAPGSFSNFWTTSADYFHMFAQYTNGTYVAFSNGDFTVFRILKELEGKKIVSMSMPDSGSYLAVTSDGSVLTQSIYNPNPQGTDLAPQNLQGKGPAKVVSTYNYSAVLRKGAVAGSGSL